jgi:hypothetical protein
LTVGTGYRDVVWNGTNWIVVGTSATNNYLYATTPSGTWTPGATGSGATVTKIFWDGTRHTLIDGTTWRFSTSLTIGTATQLEAGPVVSTSTKKEILYSGIIYYSLEKTPQYIVGFTTQSSNFPLQINPIINPADYTTSDNAAGGLWVGAQGIITGDTTGRIWTSF